MVAVTAGSVLAPRPLLRPFLIIGAGCAVLPDIDAIGRLFYGASGDVQALGSHRAFTHSLTFATLLGVVVSLMALIDPRWRGHRVRVGLFVAIATGLHGVLDVFTSIGAAQRPHPCSSSAPFRRADMLSPGIRSMGRSASCFSACCRCSVSREGCGTCDAFLGRGGDRRMAPSALDCMESRCRA